MIERKIIIGLITSTEYCEKIRNVISIPLLESTMAKRLGNWCLEYYDKYLKAPGIDIETIYYAKLKTDNVPKAVAEEIEQDILPSLNEEFLEEGLNLEHLLAESAKYFAERHISLHIEQVRSLLAVGDVSEAEETIKKFAPLDYATESINNHVRTISQIRKLERGKPTLLMKPWLREGQIYILYGPPGSGKTLLALTIGYVLGTKHYDRAECEIGKWQVKKPTGCLYVDGELGEVEMEERVQQFEWLGIQSGRHRLRVLSLPEYQLETNDTFYLSNRINQKKIIKWLKDHPNYKFVILDSVSTLFGLEDENNNSEWNNKVNPILRSFRALGVACLVLHHSGKDNKRGLRGASAMSAMANGIFRLTNHENKDIDEGEAWFVLGKDKQRTAGFSFRTFAMRFEQNMDKTETHWNVNYEY